MLTNERYDHLEFGKKASSSRQAAAGQQQLQKELDTVSAELVAAKRRLENLEQLTQQRTREKNDLDIPDPSAGRFGVLDTATKHRRREELVREIGTLEKEQDKVRSKVAVLQSRVAALERDLRGASLGAICVLCRQPANAEIYLNGKKVGSGRAEAGELQPGKYTIKISARGFIDRVEEIALEAGQAQEITIESLDTVPPKLPPQRPPNTTGSGRGGVQTESRSGTQPKPRYGPALLMKLLVVLAAIVLAIWLFSHGRSPGIPYGSLDIKVHGPESARMYLDGSQASVGTAPGLLQNLRPGRHTVKLEADGYATETRQIQVLDKAKLNLSVEMAYVPKREGIVTVVSGDTFTIGLGKRDGLTLDTPLVLEKAAKPIIVNGQTLGYEESELRLVRLEENTAVAALAKSGDDAPRIGDRVKLR